MMAAILGLLMSDPYFTVLLILLCMDTIAGSSLAFLKGEFSWFNLTKGIWKFITYLAMAIVFHFTGTSVGMSFLIGREFNSFLQNAGKTNDLLGVEDGDIFYRMSEWYNLNQREVKR